MRSTASTMADKNYNFLVSPHVQMFREILLKIQS